MGAKYRVLERQDGRFWVETRGNWFDSWWRVKDYSGKGRAPDLLFDTLEEARAAGERAARRIDAQAAECKQRKHDESIKRIIA